MHEHGKECKHNLKHCSVCDVVYCSKCKYEWRKPQFGYYWYNTPYSTQVYPNITVGNTDAPVLTHTDCSH